MSDKYKPEHDIDTVPITSVKGDNQPPKQNSSSTSEPSTVITTMVFDHMTIKPSNEKED